MEENLLGQNRSTEGVQGDKVVKIEQEGGQGALNRSPEVMRLIESTRVVTRLRHGIDYVNSSPDTDKLYGYIKESEKLLITTDRGGSVILFKAAKELYELWKSEGRNPKLKMVAINRMDDTFDLSGDFEPKSQA